MTQQPNRCDTCPNYEQGSQWCAFLKERISNLEFTLIERVGCGAHPDSITLTPTLAQHYAELAKTKGKSVGGLVVRDLEEYHESRRYYANTREKMHP